MHRVLRISLTDSPEGRTLGHPSTKGPQDAEAITCHVRRLAALFVALGGDAVAATTANFILGTSNSATSTTALSAPIVGPALQISNTSTTTGATALRLNVAAGHAPLTVSSGAGKATNLNADQLDGRDSTGFVQGRGTLLSSRIVFIPTAAKKLLTIPGLGYLQAQCTGGTGAYVAWFNDSGGPVDMWSDTNNSHFDGIVAPSGNGYSIVRTANAIYGATLALGVGNDPGARRIAVLHVFAFQQGSGWPCGFQVQGTLWTSP